MSEKNNDTECIEKRIYTKLRLNERLTRSEMNILYKYGEDYIEEIVKFMDLVEPEDKKLKLLIEEYKYLKRISIDTTYSMKKILRLIRKETEKGEIIHG